MNKQGKPTMLVAITAVLGQMPHGRQFTVAEMAAEVGGWCPALKVCDVRRPLIERVARTLFDLRPSGAVVLERRDKSGPVYSKGRKQRLAREAYLGTAFRVRGRGKVAAREKAWRSLREEMDIQPSPYDKLEELEGQAL